LLLFEGMAAHPMLAGVSICLPLALDHRTMILRDKAYSRSARDAFLDCIRAATVSICALLTKLLAIIAIIGTIVAIIRKSRTATWIGIYCANQARTSQQSLIVWHNQFTLSHHSFILTSIGRICSPCDSVLNPQFQKMSSIK
jgi:hypothetical protein